jgi:hypothetical protein
MAMLKFSIERMTNLKAISNLFTQDIQKDFVENGSSYT